MYRSRLQSLEYRRNLRQTILLSLGLVTLIGILISFGMPILTRIAIFLSTLRASTQVVEKTDIIPPAPPEFIRMYIATNSAQQTISGYAEIGSTVYLTQDTQVKTNVVVGDDSKFDFDIKLEPGNNAFQAVAVDQAGNKSFVSPEYILSYSNKSPKLTLESPTDNQTTTTHINVRGSVENATRLSVNDRVLILTNNKFDSILDVPEGDNTLIFLVLDQYGNQTKRQISIQAKP